MRYEIINASTNEKSIIDTIMRYLEIHFAETYNYSKLKQIEVVDTLSGGSSASTVKDKILVARKNGLGLVRKNNITFDDIQEVKEINILCSTFYHELWHINTWEKYSEMYEYICHIKQGGEGDIFEAMAYLYWIEYIAHVDTVKMEDTEIMNTFCRNFVNTNWYRIEDGYQNYVKQLPYFLVRSHYLGVFEDLADKIPYKGLRDATYEFELLSKQLLDDCQMEDKEKDNNIV